MTKSETRRRNDHWRLWILGLMGVLLVFAGAGACRSTQAATDAREIADDINALERKDRDTARATAYRLCSRNAVDRAFAHASVRRNLTRTQGADAAQDAVRELQRPEVLPILNCRPNLVGMAAEPLPPVGQDEFVRRWEQRELSGEERGICPDTVIGQTLKPGDC